MTIKEEKSCHKVHYGGNLWKTFANASWGERSESGEGENPSRSSQAPRSEEGQTGEQGHSKEKEHAAVRPSHKGTQRSRAGTKSAKKVKLCPKDRSAACLCGVSVQGNELQPHRTLR